MEWIYFKKEMPPKEGIKKPFLVYRKKTDSVFVAYGNEYGYFDIFGNGISFSYWMPLPEKPKQ